MSEKPVATVELEKIKDAEELRRIIRERRKGAPARVAPPPKSS